VHHVLHLISAWVDEDHSGSATLLTGGSVEEECPVGLGEDWTPGLRRFGVRIGIRSPRSARGRCLVHNEVSQDLALDGVARLEVQLELSELHGPLAMLPVALELWRMALNGKEVTTTTLCA
jgi:hypothetical protein